MMPHVPHNPPERLLEKYRRAGPRPRRLAKYYAMCEWFDETVRPAARLPRRDEAAENTLVVFVVDNGWIQDAGPARPQAASSTREQALALRRGACARR